VILTAALMAPYGEPLLTQAERIAHR